LLRNPYPPPQNSVLSIQPLRQEIKIRHSERLFFENKNKEFGFNSQALFLVSSSLMKYRDKIL